MGKARWKLGWGAALAAGAWLRLLFFFRLRPAASGDSRIYTALARNLLAHHLYGYAGTPLQPTLIRLPGYPLFLAACDALSGRFHPAVILWAQMTLDLLGCVLLGQLSAGLAQRVVGTAETSGASPARVGLAAVWLAALCPFTANLTVVLLPESLSVFCVVTALFALERWEACLSQEKWSFRGEAGVWTAVIGWSLAWAVLLRPDQGLLAAVVLPAMLWVCSRAGARQGVGLVGRFWPATAAGLLLLLPLLAWGARNWSVFHVLQPLAPRYAQDPDEQPPVGFYRWYRSWAIEYKSNLDIYWRYDDDPIHMRDLPARAIDNPQQRRETQEVFDGYNRILTATPELDAEFARIANQRIATHPVRYYVGLPMARELDMWLRPRLEFLAMPVDWWKFSLHPRQSAEEAAYALVNALYLALALFGLLRWAQRRYLGGELMAFVMLAFVALRIVLLLTLDNSEPRYTLECFPVVIVLGAMALLPQTSG